MGERAKTRTRKSLSHSNGILIRFGSQPPPENRTHPVALPPYMAHKVSFCFSRFSLQASVSPRVTENRRVSKMIRSVSTIFPKLCHQNCTKTHRPVATIFKVARNESGRPPPRQGVFFVKFSQVMTIVDFLAQYEYYI